MTYLRQFINDYKQLSAVIFVFIIALGLEFIFAKNYSYALITVFAITISIGLVRSMFSAIKQQKFGVDILALLSIFSTLAIGQFWATIVILLMLIGGQALESFASRRAKNELSILLDRAPKLGHVISSNGTIHDVDVELIDVGSLIQIMPGEIVPLDAVIVSGNTMVDESSITGESLPVSVSKNSIIISGSVNISSAIKAKTTAKSVDSQYSQIIDLVRSASDSTSPIIRLADRYAIPFTVVSLVIAGLAWFFSKDPARFAEVLVVATPCPLLIAAPVALISGMSSAAKQGIIIKSGAILENLSRAKTYVFDKTGTLTHSRLTVADTIPASRSITQSEIISLAASAEQQSLHILGKTILDYARKHNYKLSKVSKLDEYPGQGIMAMVENNKILVGNINFIKKHKIKIPKKFASTSTAMYLAKNNLFIGLITFEDEVRNNSRLTIDKLRKLGINNFLMLTGDNLNTAHKVAKQVSINTVYAKCLPKDKLQIIKSQPITPTVMIGDGINDAPVLAASDIGIAMGAYGQTAASQSADIVIMKDDIYKVARVASISKRTIKIAKESIFIGIGASLVLMLVASTGKIPAILGAGLQELLDIMVIVNALRAHKQSKNDESN